MSKIIIENVPLREIDPFEKEMQESEQLNPDKIVPSVTKTFDLGNTGYFESISIRDVDNIELIYKDAVIKIKLRP